MTSTHLLRIKQLAKELDISVSAIRIWIRDGLLPTSCYVRIGNTYRFDLAMIREVCRDWPQVTSKPTVETQLELDLETQQFPKQDIL